MKTIDLTTGHITKKLVALALPIMGGSFIQMAYNMTDMLWIGKIGSSAVAAVGTAGFFTWLAMAFILVSKTGAEIKIAHSIGQKDENLTKGYVISALQLNIILAIAYTVVMLVGCDWFIGFFKLGDPEVISMAKTYLIVVSWGLIFYFINPLFTSIFTGAGDSKTPFIMNTIGLVLNMVFDPILILGWFGFPAMGVLGAAIATVGAQMVVTLCFCFIMVKRKVSYLSLNVFERPRLDLIKTLVRLGLPGAIQSGLFTIFSMVIGRIIAVWGPVPIAVQKVGSQIEAISWMTAGGFSTALGTFAGQNYGAKKYERIHEGYRITMALAVGLGVFASLLLIFCGEYIFSIFLAEPEAIEQGKAYLKILGYSQLFMCIEITATGAFNGLGRPTLPAILSIVITGLRVPMAWILSRPEYMGIDGIWWSISITSVVKGIIIVGLYTYLYQKDKLYPRLQEAVAEEITSIEA